MNPTPDSYYILNTKLMPDLLYGLVLRYDHTKLTSVHHYFISPIAQVLRYDHQERMTAAEALDHPWLAPVKEFAARRRAEVRRFKICGGGERILIYICSPFCIYPLSSLSNPHPLSALKELGTLPILPPPSSSSSEGADATATTAAAAVATGTVTVAAAAAVPGVAHTELQ